MIKPNRNYIPRPLYIERIRPFIGQDIIKVITGQRRVGKSYLLYQLMDMFATLDAEASIIYINKELNEFSGITTFKELLDYVHQIEKGAQRTYLLIDEVQDIMDFEKALRSLQAEGSYDIYCTGSNASMLSGELATYLSGRYVEIKIFGLSYSEFLTFHQRPDSVQVFTEYLKKGGLPYLIHLPEEEIIVYEYLRNIYNTILYKDVIARHGVRNIPFLENLVKFLSGNTGSLVSAKRISDFLKSQRINISTQVVLNYLRYLESAFFIFKVSRADITGRKIFEVGEKYYFEDLGLRNSVIGYRAADIGKMLENIVFIHLKIAGFTIYVGKTGDKEVDFICEKEGERIYVQVCYLLSNAETIQREYASLIEIPDNYPKYLLSMDEIGKTTSYRGIEHVHIKDFCLKLTTAQNKADT
ncbi:MAG: ATP-binding protein [Bacteroidales bacterium]|nr:ATP-binding protein [Bacteroidales bacterium]MDZ4205005.1 ATP-binding protein [Bacteroidales bacterium]